jgi:hypothetical protein
MYKRKFDAENIKPPETIIEYLSLQNIKTPKTMPMMLIKLSFLPTIFPLVAATRGHHKGFLVGREQAPVHI